jgi:hypothetical protein
LQRAAYTEVSIRELLKWVQRLGRYIQQQRQPQLGATETVPVPVPGQVLSDTAYMVYVARFRTTEALHAVLAVIRDCDWPVPGMVTGMPGSAAVAATAVMQGFVQTRGAAVASSSNSSSRAGVQATSGGGSLEELLGTAHAAVLQMLREPALWQQHGLYMVPPSWRHHWQQQLKDLHHPSRQVVGLVGLCLYANALSGDVAVAATAAAAIGCCFQLPDGLVMDAAAAAQHSPGSAAAVLKGELPEGLQLAPLAPLAPYVVTPRVLQAWQVAGSALAAGEPVLVVGGEGCGKSSCLAALAWLLEQEMQAVALTPGGYACCSLLLECACCTATSDCCFGPCCFTQVTTIMDIITWRRSASTSSCIGHRPQTCLFGTTSF